MTDPLLIVVVEYSDGRPDLVFELYSAAEIMAFPKRLQSWYIPSWSGGGFEP